MPGRVFVTATTGMMLALEEGGKLVSLDFIKTAIAPGLLDRTPLLMEVERQLEAYSDGLLKEFSIPLDLRGTPFQKAVWELLIEIPYGKTSTYGQIARELLKPLAARAVGGAIHRNPISVIVPCHRVIGASGSLTGYGGGLERKQALLELESRF